MRRYQVVIVGGGINGCGLLRDLALNGVDCLLLEKGDYSSQTSQSSSKMLHGGIRYLENFDFALIQEALEEKNLWLKLTPHLCFEREFYIPLYNYSKYPPFMLKLGLLTYDFLSHFQNRPHAMLSKTETLRQVPALDPQGLKGAGKYFDGVVDDAKLALECLYDALLEPNAEARSYHEVTHVRELPSGGHEVTYRSRLDGATTTVWARFLIFTTGPFTDKLLPALGISWKPQLVPSKGIHLWLRPGAIEASGSVVLTTEDGRVIFVIPQRDSVLVGTTETPVTEEIFNIRPHAEEVDYLLRALKKYFPKSNLDRSMLISTFAGVRPLVREDGHQENLGKVSRFHKIFRPNASTYVLLGGKYTTFRRMNQELAAEVVRRLGIPYRPNLTLDPLRQRSLIPTFGPRPRLTEDLLREIIRRERATTFEDLISRRLSLLEAPAEIQDVLGLPPAKVRAILESVRET